MNIKEHAENRLVYQQLNPKNLIKRLQGCLHDRKKVERSR